MNQQDEIKQAEKDAVNAAIMTRLLMEHCYTQGSITGILIMIPVAIGAACLSLGLSHGINQLAGAGVGIMGLSLPILLIANRRFDQILKRVK